MTEAAFQQCRIIMQRANYIRGKITTAKGDVAKWGNIESSHREQLRHGQADGAKKMLDKAMEKLDMWRGRFAELMFPDPNVKVTLVRCAECSKKIEECICNDY